MEDVLDRRYNSVMTNALAYTVHGLARGSVVLQLRLKLVRRGASAATEDVHTRIRDAACAAAQSSAEQHASRLDETKNLRPHPLHHSPRPPPEDVHTRLRGAACVAEAFMQASSVMQPSSVAKPSRISLDRSAHTEDGLQQSFYPTPWGQSPSVLQPTQVRSVAKPAGFVLPPPPSTPPTTLVHWPPPSPPTVPPSQSASSSQHPEPPPALDLAVWESSLCCSVATPAGSVPPPPPSRAPPRDRIRLVSAKELQARILHPLRVSV